MNNKNILLAQALTYCGILPFLLLSVALSLHLGGPPCLTALLAYGLAIIAFLSGIHWAVFLFFSARCRYNLFLLSNALALMAWSALLFANPMLGLGLQMICFVSLLMLDRDLYRRNVFPAWFYRLRCHATWGVLGLLAATAVLL